MAARKRSLVINSILLSKRQSIEFKQVRGDASRQGGVIWHTTGSGKSLTMVLLAKALVTRENYSQSEDYSS